MASSDIAKQTTPSPDTPSSSSSSSLLRGYRRGRARLSLRFPRFGSPLSAAVVAAAAPNPRQALATALFLEAMAVVVLALLLAGTSNTAQANPGRLAADLPGGRTGVMTHGSSRALMQQASSSSSSNSLPVQIVGKPPGAMIPGAGAGVPGVDRGTGSGGGGGGAALETSVASQPAAALAPALTTGGGGGTGNIIGDAIANIMGGGGGGGAIGTVSSNLGGSSGGGGGGSGGSTSGDGGGSSVMAPNLSGGGPMPADQNELAVNSSSTADNVTNPTNLTAVGTRGGSTGSSISSDVSGAFELPASDVGSGGDVSAHNVVAAAGPDDADASGGGGTGGGSSVMAPTLSGGGPMPTDQDNRGGDLGSLTAASSDIPSDDTDTDTDTLGSSGSSSSSDRGAVAPPAVATGVTASAGPGQLDDSSSWAGARGSSGGSSGGGKVAGIRSDARHGADGWPCDWRRAHSDCVMGYSCIPSSSSASDEGTCTANPVGGNPIPPNLGYPVVFYPLTNGSLGTWPPGSGSAYDGLIVQGNVYAEPLENSDPDELFPGAITCDQGSSSLVAIPGLTYGRTGAFTINFWMRKRPEDTAAGPDDMDMYGGNAYDNSDTNTSNSNRTSWVPPVYEYMLTHANLQPLGPQAAKYTPMDRNQIAVYLAPRTSSLYGIARAYVKDTNDGRGAVFLDSDGRVADNDQTRPEYRPWNLTDGDWHMITLSSQPGGGRGWRMYVDGALAVQIPSPLYPPGSSPSRGLNVSTGAEIDGGDPLYLGGPLLLCGRYGGPYSRAYGGQLANLAVFDAALDTAQVATLYDMVRDPEAVTLPTLPLRRHPWYGSTLLTPPDWMAADESDDRLAEEYGTLTGAPKRPPPPPPPALNSSATATNASRYDSALAAVAKALENALLEALTGVSYNRSAGMTCSLDLRREAGLAFCAPGLVCAPVSASARTKPLDAWMNVTGGGDNSSRVYSPAAAAAAMDAAASASALLGICTPPTSGMILPYSWPADWPAPAAHFPLTRGSLRSWPAGAYGGRVVNATWVPDSRFGQVVQCDRAARSRIVLDAVPYGTRGPMAVNLWVRTSRGDLTPRGDDSPGLQYVFSHAAGGPFVNFGPNQVHMYIPEVGSPLYGISVRAILRDGNDFNLGRPSEVYLDSDGSVGNDLPRLWAPRDDGVDISDGGWHMLTLSSNWSSPGYSLYVDGILRGQLLPGAVRSTTNMSDTDIQVTGGGPLQLSGPIVLCGRADGDPDRHFGGSVAALSVFDAALQPWQVAALYGSYQHQAVLMPAGQVMRGGGYISAMATTGDPCVFPVSYGGRNMYGCITLNGVLSCPIAGGNLAPCTISRQLGAVPLDGTSGDVLIPDNPSNSSSDSDYESSTTSASPQAPNVSDNNDNNTAAVLRQLRSYNLADGVMLGPAGGSMPRLTVGGQLCVFPFDLDNVTYNNCANVGGVEFCPTLDLDPGGDVVSLMECAPAIVRPPDSTRCRPPLPYGQGSSDADGQDYQASEGAEAGGKDKVLERHFSQCINMMGVDACQTQEGLWLICPPPPRTTATGATCQVPYKLGAIMRTDCIVPGSATSISLANNSGIISGSSSPRGSSANSNGSSILRGREVCPVGEGELEICLPTYVPPPTLQPRSPIRVTVDRRRCLPPGPGALSECADYEAAALAERTATADDVLNVAVTDSGGSGGIGGRYSCEVDNGEILECAPVERVTLGGLGRPPEVCAFPFVYRLRNRTDCVWLEGVEACKVADGSWAECSPHFITRFPEPPNNMTSGPRYSVSGQPCQIPFFYNGSLQWDCMAAKGEGDGDGEAEGGEGPPPAGYCRSVGGSWEQCMPRAQGGRPRTTITGQPCQLPFFPPPSLASPSPPGSVSSPQPVYDCVGPPPGSCLNPQGRMEPCAPRPRIANTGEPCSLPFTFRNATFYDCFTPPPDVAAAALASVAAADTGGGNGSGAPSSHEFCSTVPVSYDASELRPCLPLDPEVQQQPPPDQVGSSGGTLGAVAPPSSAPAPIPDFSPDPSSGSDLESGSRSGSGSGSDIASGTAGYGNMQAAQVDPLAAAAGNAGGSADDAAATAKRRRDLGLGLGLGVGLPGMILLIAGLATLRRQLAKHHMRRVIREMRMDAPAVTTAALPMASLTSFSHGPRGPAASGGSTGSGGNEYGSGTLFGTRLPGFAGPTSKVVPSSARGDAGAEVEMSEGLGASGGNAKALSPAAPPARSDGDIATPLLPVSSVHSHTSLSGLQTAASGGGGGSATAALPPGALSQQTTGSSIGSSSATVPIRPPRPAPPPPFPRSGGGNAFASGQLSPASSLGNGVGVGVGGIRSGGGGGLNRGSSSAV